ncbi:FxSxx-COOH system tetratricopeptide repeat protein [Streptomyces bambusae]|uniref:Tetratricopeptide repeat protein n=1 Tax=Streptomyces bambusae TaxID=1550616 RepID=A0ABS6Z6Q7_9ACTN|nr:FxSxx-COOH system tetratricopeptide repeat protein [Streptomyces bambusae]MBW5483448.1 tetratricopeptide repeat protein [Streptomyces bambusae]
MADGNQRFFISYAGIDRPWAEWVGWHLERAGHRVVLDVWDWRTGDDFVDHMDRALAGADAVVALFSRAYFDPERWTREERNATVALRSRVIPLALEPLVMADIPATLAAKLRKNLHGLGEVAALEALKEAVNGGSRPDGPPPFPGPGGRQAPPGGAGAAAGETAPAGDDFPTGEDFRAAEHLAPRLPRVDGEPEVWKADRRNPDFAGREAQIVALREDLLSGRQAVVRALHGMGGIGKTQIALEYAHRFKAQYDIVWWIDAEQADQIPVHYTELADRLGIAKPEAGSESNARALLSALRTRPRWLLILDNAEQPAQIAPWLPEGPGHVLITSRNPDWHGVAAQTPLEVFTRADSLAYLTARVTGIPTDQADLLAQDLGDLPLALAQAAGVVGSGMTAEHYRELLATNTERILSEKAPQGYAASLAAAVEIAAGRLGNEHPEAVSVLMLGAFFGPEPIPLAWLEGVRPALRSLADAEGDLMWPQPELASLRRYGLVRLDRATFQIHRLTQGVLRDRTAPEQAGLIRADVATVLAAIDPGDPKRPENWPAWASLTAHLTAQPDLCAERPELRRTLLGAVHFLLHSGRTRTAHSVASSLSEVWIASLGKEDPDTLTCLQYLGHATAEGIDAGGAVPLIKETLELRRRVLGEDHPDTLQSLNDLGATMSRLGRHRDAQDLAEEAFARRRRVLGEDHPDTLQSASNAAAALFGLGEVREAERMAQDALVRGRQVLGDDHPTTLKLGAMLPTILMQLGEFGKAFRMAEESQLRLARTLGDDHPDTIGSAEAVALALRGLGRRQEAYEAARDVLDRRRRVFGGDHPRTLQAASQVSLALRELREVAEAHELAQDTLARARRVLGDDHPATVVGQAVAGAALGSLQRYDEAVELLKDALDRQRRIIGSGHPDTLGTARLLAEVYIAMRKPFAAQRLLMGQVKQTKQAKRGRKGKK